MSRSVGEIDRWHERLKLFSDGKLVVHRCDSWKHEEILHIVSKKSCAVYVGKQMSNIHVTGISYIKIEFLTLQTSVLVPHFHLTLPTLAVLFLHVLVCDLNLQ
jgi:hypothetical protein